MPESIIVDERIPVPLGRERFKTAKSISNARKDIHDKEKGNYQTIIPLKMDKLVGKNNIINHFRFKLFSHMKNIIDKN